MTGITPEQLAEWKRFADAEPVMPVWPGTYTDLFRTAVPALVAEVERLTAENERVRTAWQRTNWETIKVMNERDRALAIIARVREWAMQNEIAAPPLDWATLGAALAAEREKVAALTAVFRSRMEAGRAEIADLRGDLAQAHAEVERLMLQCTDLLEKVDALSQIAREAQNVMDALVDHGPGIVGHLLDTDDNAGQRLRVLLHALAGEKEGGDVRQDG